MIRLAEAERLHCRAVIGETNGADTMYCGERVCHKRNFCPEHQARYYTRMTAADIRLAKEQFAVKRMSILLGNRL